MVVACLSTSKGVCREKDTARGTTSKKEARTMILKKTIEQRILVNAGAASPYRDFVLTLQ
jgi:hypothetical protein